MAYSSLIGARVKRKEDPRFVRGKGNFVEVQGSAETHGGFSRERFNQMLDLAAAGCEKLMEIQKGSIGV